MSLWVLGPAPRKAEAEAVSDRLEGGQQLVNHPRDPIGPGVDPAGLSNQVVPVDPGAEQLARLHLTRDRLIGHDSDAKARFDHRLYDFYVFRVHYDGRLDILAREEAVDHLPRRRSPLKKDEREKP